MDLVVDPNGHSDDPPVTVEAADDVATDELLERVARWDAALRERDERAADALLAPDFAVELVQPVRSLMDRDIWLEVLADYVVDEWVVEEQVVDQAEDVASLLQRVRVRATAMGEDRSGVFVITDLWRRVDGEWRLWRRHQTPLSLGPLSPGPLPSTPVS
jgi:ketosteroid isomerase-like protein